MCCIFLSEITRVKCKFCLLRVTNGSDEQIIDTYFAHPHARDHYITRFGCSIIYHCYDPMRKKNPLMKYSRNLNDMIKFEIPIF